MSAELHKLKELVDPQSLLRALDFTFYSQNSEEYRGPCFLHGGDNKTAFCLKKETKRFYCYTKHCEHNHLGEVDNDVVSLVMKAKSCSFAQAVEFLCELTGFDLEEGIDEVKYREDQRHREKSRFMDNIARSNQLPTISEDLVKIYATKGCSYFINKGFSKDIIEEFELGLYTDGSGIERVSIPIRDEFGRLVSISGRRTDSDEDPRYRLLKEFKKRRVLYNLYRAKWVRKLYKYTIIVVEGFKALWWVKMAGFPNVVAVMGATIRPEQVNLLIKTGFMNCILMLDGNEAGIAGMNTSAKFLANKLNLYSAFLPQGKSPDDVSLKEMNEFLSMFYNMIAEV